MARFYDTVTEIPESPNNDDGPYTLSTRMSFGVDGSITEIHFRFPNTLPSGPVEAGVYLDSGPTLMRDPADVFVAPVAGQWNTVVLADPIPVTAGLAYSPAVLTPNRYTATGGFFGSIITRGDITTPISAGKFNGGASWGFPNGQFANSAYYVDVTFVPDGGTTPVSSTLDLRWAVRSVASQTVDARWTVRATISGTSDLRWALRAIVSGALDARWGVRAVVAASAADLRWAVRAPVSAATLDIRWVVNLGALAAIDLRWAVQSLVESALNLRWRIEGVAIETLPPVAIPATSLRPAELKVQRKLTEAFLRADGRTIILQRRERTPDGAGGFETGPAVAQAPQLFRLLPQEDGATARTTSEGETATPEYMLLGRWDANLERFDEFVIDGRRYQVVFISENRQYEKKGEVTYLGE